MKGKGGSANAAKAKKIVKNAAKQVKQFFSNTKMLLETNYTFFFQKEFTKSMKDVKNAIFKEHKEEAAAGADKSANGPKSIALDRFKPKSKVKK